MKTLNRTKFGQRAVFEMAFVFFIVLLICGFPDYPALGTALGLDAQTYPRVDGSTSTLPLQAAVKSTVLGGDQSVTRSDTHQAYMNLINGLTDFILVARAPSWDEEDASSRTGVRLVPNPVAIDALVFILDANNRVTGLTLDGIRDIMREE